MHNHTKFSRNEKGQAIILIVFAIVGLIGLTALTVDGGNAFSNRRHAQNAADTTAFAAARATVRHDLGWKDTALNIANENGFLDENPDDTSTETKVNVEIYTCDEATPSPRPDYADCGEYEDDALDQDYIVVVITSTVDTYFAPVIGIQQVTNRVLSISLAQPTYVDEDSLGDAMVSLMQGCKGDTSWPHDPFTMSGTSTSIVGGSGVFVNSDCDNAFNQNGSASMDAEFGVCVVGTSNYAPGSVIPPPEDNCGTPLPYPPFVPPNPECDIDGNGSIDPAEEGVITEISNSPRIYRSTPGYYAGDFPNTSPSGQLIMQKGVYCIEDDFDLHSDWEITTDVDDSGTFDEDYEGVLITTVNGGITLNGTSSIDLHAMSSDDVDPDLQDLLFYIPFGNESTLTVNGSNGSEFTGSIWAPSAHCSVEGNSSYDVNSQVMCYTIGLSGNGDINITYDSTENHVIQIPPSIELSE